LKNIWNYHPTLPIETSPVFNWPPRLSVSIMWLLSFLSVRGVFLIGIYIVWFTVHPKLGDIAIGDNLWYVQIYSINFLMITLLAGGLHAYYYVFSLQDSSHRFEKRDMEKSKRFTFNDQVLDNIFWTLVSSIAIWTFYQCLLLVAYKKGFAPLHSWEDGPVWYMFLFVLITFYISLYFYCTHRMLHWRILYKSVHFLHHRNIATGPWSGLSMHPVEHLAYFGSVLIHLVILSSPIHVVFHLAWLVP